MINDEQHTRKWRLILGGQENDGTGFTLNERDQQMDKTLEALYDSERKGSLGLLRPMRAGWAIFIAVLSIAHCAGNAAGCGLNRLNLSQMLLEKEMCLRTLRPMYTPVATFIDAEQSNSR